MINCQVYKIIVNKAVRMKDNAVPLTATKIMYEFGIFKGIYVASLTTL